MTAEHSRFIFEVKNKVNQLVMEAFSSGVNYGYQLQKEVFANAMGINLEEIAEEEDEKEEATAQGE